MSIEDYLRRIEHLAEVVIRQDELHQALLDASPWGILVVDEKYNIVYINKPLEVLSGWTLAELDGKHLHTVIPKDDRKIHKEHEKDFKKTPRTRHGDYPLRPQLLCKDGSLVEVEISLGHSIIRGSRYFFASIRERDTLPPADT